MMKVPCLVLLLIAAAVVAPPLSEAAAQLSCGSVTSTLAPCFQFVLGGGAIPTNCCNSVKALYKEADTAAARRNICVCLKSITSSASPTALKNAKSLPGKCGINLPYQITPSIDCNKVN